MDFSARSILRVLVIGLVVGAIATLLLPGKLPDGCIITSLFLNGCSKKNPSYHCLRRSLPRLGFDLSRYPLRHREYSAVSNGWHAIPVGRRNHVCDCVVAGQL